MMAEGWVRRKEGDEEDIEFRRKRRNHNCFEATRAQRTRGGSKGIKKEGSTGHLANVTLSRVEWHALQWIYWSCHPEYDLFWYMIFIFCFETRSLCRPGRA